MLKKINWWLILILVLAGCLRVIWLTKYPAGFSPDEADIGYNAYSLLKTGKDEWGTVGWKLFFQNMRSFGDYKLPLYSFFAIPTIALLGLSEFAVRLPGAILGTTAVIGVYYLAKELFPNKKIAILSALVLAISPWHISLSRGAFEANLITFFLPWIVYFFLKKKYLLFSIFLATSLYTYHTPRYLAPLFILILVISQKVKFNRQFVLPAVVFVALSLPAAISVVGTGHARVADVSLLSPTDNWQGVASRRFEARNLGLPDPIARAFSNKVTQTTMTFVDNYLAYLSPDFLFVSGASEASHGLIPGRGVMYLVELIFLAAFIVALIKTKSPSLILLALLLLVSPIPASLSKGLGHATNRAAPMIPLLSIMTAAGLVYLVEQQKKYRAKLYPIILAVYVVSLTFFLEDYLFHAPKVTAPQMSYGWRELMPRLAGIAQEYDQIQVSRSFSESQIFVAFYQQIDPAEFQAQSQSWKDFDAGGLKFLDQYDGYSLGKYRFGSLDLDLARSQKTLLVGNPADIPTRLGQYFSIYYPDGSPAIQVSKFSP